MLELGETTSTPTEEASLGQVPFTAEPCQKQPGYYQVFLSRSNACRHPDPLPLNAGDVKSLVSEALYRSQSAEPRVDCVLHGPAVTLSHSHYQTVDYVPCLRLGRPSGRCWLQALRDRRRPAGWPPASLLDQLTESAHLVPVGPNQPDRQLWRLSFSPAEALLARSLPGRQRYCLLLLKAAKKRCVQQAAGVRSYYFKTCVFWLSESRPHVQWLDNMDSVLAVMEMLEQSVVNGYLPCFLLPELNIFGGHDAKGLADLQEHVRYLKDNLRVTLYETLRGLNKMEVEHLYKTKEDNTDRRMEGWSNQNRLHN